MNERMHVDMSTIYYSAVESTGESDDNTVNLSTSIMYTESGAVILF